MTDGMAVEWNIKVYLNFWQVTVYQVMINEGEVKVGYPKKQ